MLDKALKRGGLERTYAKGPEMEKAEDEMEACRVKKKSPASSMVEKTDLYLEVASLTGTRWRRMNIQ